MSRGGAIESAATTIAPVAPAGARRCGPVSGPDRFWRFPMREPAPARPGGSGGIGEGGWR
jgi:hypothetical protein